MIYEKLSQVYDYLSRKLDFIFWEIQWQKMGYFLFQLIFNILLSIVGCIGFLLLGIFLKTKTFFCNDKGPILYKQERMGKNGVPFYIYKFRTMAVDADQFLYEDKELYKQYIENDYKLPLGQDPRVTKLGLFLRKWSLDELPQFWNVVKGDMSIIGPRPVVRDELKNYADYKEVVTLLSMKPGIIGYWQVMGRSNLRYPKRCAMELYYVEHASVGLDLKIFLKSIVTVLKHVGAY
ncbi:sugar transferase [Bombilactobacillus folatiphilus]|uniref:Sugar transferase n=1 Tax=Bombilactobacillus folatiphilus TaxID=2923362 RepID=A0ABY4P7T5_9LACO|nr:sugar transferase [Bombilactobacillus folatiphilus]UQS81717.1 sugar transferase [Bombilactobacillus folatiphilus]